MEQIFNKLVRNNIPDKMRDDGEQAIVRVLSMEEYKIELYKRLEEGTNEVINAENNEVLIEELSDLYEVLNSIMLINKLNFNEVENARKQKLDEYGGYEKRIYLKKTISKND